MNRIVQLYNSETKEWYIVHPSQIKKGNSFRMFDDINSGPLLNWDDTDYFVATNDSKKDKETGMWSVECAWSKYSEIFKPEKEEGDI